MLFFTQFYSTIHQNGDKTAWHKTYMGVVQLYYFKILPPIGELFHMLNAPTSNKLLLFLDRGDIPLKSLLKRTFTVLTANATARRLR